MLRLVNAKAYRCQALPVPALLDDGEMPLDEDGEDPQRGRVHVHQLDFLTYMIASASNACVKSFTVNFKL
jgi:hypothetical protein